MRKGCVTLVGAGCGKGMITVAGLLKIREAEAIFYDDLIDDDLLLEAREGCEFVYVGKRYGKMSAHQDEIESMMIDRARAGKCVVRLKGGDSFVFGRGGEEVLALQAADVPYEMVPGISSSIAVPEVMGIPVTHRQMSRSFTVVTGHTTDGTGESFQALASLKGTLVFLMGLTSAGAIAEQLMAHGKDPETPAAVLSRGFSREEKRYDCTLGTLGETAQKAAPPAILVVGDVAGFHMEATSVAPLRGVRVEVTGTEHFTALMQEKLLSLGADVVRTPCLRIHPTVDAIPFDFTPYSYFAFTSANGVKLFFEEMKRRGVDLRSFYGKKFAVIGTGTAKALAEHGILADFIPSVYTSKVFGEELGANILEEKGGTGSVSSSTAVTCSSNGSGRRTETHRIHTEMSQTFPCGRDSDAGEVPMGTGISHGSEGANVLILRAREGSPELTEALDRAGIFYKDVAIYETGTFASEDQEGMPGHAACDYVTFSSAAGVRAYFQEHALEETATPVCIGPATAAQFERLSDRKYLMPPVHTADGMVATILAEVRDEELDC
ncbi:MAG: uroporphyrinogen-III C-methyltransferase [Lachnospiraceae bacterium]|nr:uroporphyrinogen-III C-methyltransferase [Lachnospiraceae bacterium]